MFFLYIQKEERNASQNVLKPFCLFAYFPLTTNEIELDYYHETPNVRIGSPVAERIKTCDMN